MRLLKWLLACLLTICQPSYSASNVSRTIHDQRAATSRLENLRAEHQLVLNQLNVKDAKGRPLELDDPRIPDLVKKGWGLAGKWAATFFESHPKPSARDMKKLFDGFAPAPAGFKSPDGDLEYHDYSLSGDAVRVGPSVYVVKASYAVDFPTSTFMVVARNSQDHFQAMWDIKT